ncbi:lysis protein [Pseudomonas sp. RIT411]|nr:lysis protein [Pseudomonas sp. RIT 411]
MGTGFGWVLNGWRLEGRVARAEGATERESKEHQADLAAISNAAVQQVTQALAKQQEAQHAVAELDKKATKERNDAKAENDRLRARLDAGGRVRVAGNCPANPVSMPTAAGTTSVDHAGTVELSPEAGRNVLDIRAGIIADQAALRALQAYVREVCLASQ